MEAYTGTRLLRAGALLVGVLVLAACQSGDDVGPGATTPTSSADQASPNGLPTASSSPSSPAAEAAVPPLHPSIDGYPEATLRLVPPVDDTPVLLPVKVAATAERRAHGLMEVDHLPDGTGMWFVFDQPHTGGFWMKNTLVPLDIAFVAADGTVEAVLQMDPCVEDPCPVYDPGVAYTTALEVPQGWFAGIGFDVEWRVATTDGG